MAQDQRQQYAQMLSAMPPNVLQTMKKELQRRFVFFGVGLVCSSSAASSTCSRCSCRRW
jgi:hypothetical protein